MNMNIVLATSGALVSAAVYVWVTYYLWKEAIISTEQMKAADRIYGLVLVGSLVVLVVLWLGRYV